MQTSWAFPTSLHCNKRDQNSLGQFSEAAIRSKALKYESTSDSRNGGTNAMCLLISKAEAMEVECGRFTGRGAVAPELSHGDAFSAPQALCSLFQPPSF